MNAELARIRKSRNYKEEIHREAIRMKDERVDEMMLQLNTNMQELSIMANNGEIDIDYFIDKIITNMYIVLNAFNEIGIYPDYFYDNYFKLKLEYQKVIETSGEYKSDYRFLDGIKVSTKARISKIFEKGLENGHGNYKAHKVRDLDANYKDMISYFKEFKMPYGIKTKEQCKRIFDRIHFNQINILQSLILDDVLSDDIESLVRLLFEYMTFFAAIGVSPKEYMEKYIDTVCDVRAKSK